MADDSRASVEAGPDAAQDGDGLAGHSITHTETKRFQPANITFDLLPLLDEETRKRVRDKKERHRLVCARGLRVAFPCKAALI